MAFVNRTHTSRWRDKNSYDVNWSTRSKLLLNMFISSEAEDGKRYRISEYGCGANAPFDRICRSNDRFFVKKFDIEAWDDETHIFDLNEVGSNFEKSDIATFSGVLEYLNDVPYVLRRAIKAHRYLLISYAFLPMSAKASDAKYLKCIQSRSMCNGWRNHYSIEDIARICTGIGVISNTGMWKRRQSLFLIRQFEGMV